MAVALEFINLILRKDAIEARYDGGWTKFLARHAGSLGRIAWHDDYLFRIGAMNPGDIGFLVEQYGRFGLQLYRESEGKPVEWLDGCVVEFGGSTLPCSWIEFTKAGAAYLTGTLPGAVIGRYAFEERIKE